MAPFSPLGTHHQQITEVEVTLLYLYKKQQIKYLGYTCWGQDLTTEICHWTYESNRLE
jgi:hypothetical protein